MIIHRVAVLQLLQCDTIYTFIIAADIITKRMLLIEGGKGFHEQSGITHFLIHMQFLYDDSLFLFHGFLTDIQLLYKIQKQIQRFLYIGCR